MYITPFPMHHGFYTIPKLTFMLYNFLYTIYITLFTQHHLHCTLFHSLLTLHCSQHYLHSALHLLQHTIYVAPCPMHNQRLINKARNGKITNMKTTVIIYVLLSYVFIFPYIIYITSFQKHNLRHTVHKTTVTSLPKHHVHQPFTIHHLRPISSKTQCALHLSPYTIYATLFPIYNLRYPVLKRPLVLHRSQCIIYVTPFPQHN